MGTAMPAAVRAVTASLSTSGPERMTRRSAQCPCGSGRKFRKCHSAAREVDPRAADGPGTGARAASPRQPSPEVLAAVRAHERREGERLAQFGHVRPVIHTEFAGQRLVAVGGRLYASPHWRTMPDFLLAFIKGKLPATWYHGELAKPLAQRHPIAQWFWRYGEFRARHQTPGADGLCSGEPDGPSTAFLVLAYELYLLADHQVLQDRLLRKLLTPDQFQGARYEVTVAAAMIRAGFDLTMEDEDDPSSPHPEFVATHPATGARVAVEAKSRHRPGVLGHPGPEAGIRDDLAHDVRRLFRAGVRKAGNGPLFLFIDANLPPGLAWERAGHFRDQFTRMVTEESRTTDPSGAAVGHAHNLLMVTNDGWHYGDPGAPAPQPLFFSHAPLPAACRHPVDHALIAAVERSLRQHGRIPTQFG